VIRQAISCDICGTEKKQTNHWFVAYEQGGEVRVSGWKSRNKLRPGSKHLCGQTCLHKLVDEFMARDLAARVQPGAAEESYIEPQAAGVPATGMDASLTSDAAYVEAESSARLVPQPVRVAPARGPGLVAMQGRLQEAEHSALLPADGAGYASKSWRAQAWEREREREQRAVDRRPDIAARRRSGS
jgi:hypothetical protein